MSGPNLSEYFRNDVPNMFDEIISNASETVATGTVAASTPSVGN